MIEIDGSPPQLAGSICDELLCQQYWYAGEMADEADVVWLKLAGNWYQLFFDAGVVHWRAQDHEPEMRAGSDDGLLAYPTVDLGAQLGLKGRVVREASVLQAAEGDAFSLAFQQAGTLTFINTGDRTQIRYRRE